MKHTKDASTIISSAWQTADNMPTLDYDSGSGAYLGTACAVSYGGNDYIRGGGDVGAASGYSIYIDSLVANLSVGKPSVVAQPERQSLTAVPGIDGTQDIDVMLLFIATVYQTLLCSHDKTASVIAAVEGIGGVFVSFSGQKYIDSVFTAHGAGADYTFNPSAITDVGATLHGGDGANGERTAIYTGTSLYSETATQDSIISGVAVSFVPNTTAPVVTKPTLEYSVPRVSYQGYCCAATRGGNNYNNDFILAFGDEKYCVFNDQSYTPVDVGTLTSSAPEPVDVFSLGVDGTNDIDMILVSAPFRITVLCANTETALLIPLLEGDGKTLVDFGGGRKYIPGAWVATGALLPYTLDESALAADGVTLWGGDGAGGERTTPGVTGQQNIACMVKVNGVSKFPVPVVGNSQYKSFNIPGRIHVAAGDVVSIEASENNTSGGTFKASISYCGGY